MASGVRPVRNFDPAEETLTLTTLADCIERFLGAWEESEREPPELTAYLPENHTHRRFLLVELIKVDLEYRWRGKGEPKYLADYLREFPELAEDGLSVDLIYEEYHIRRGCGLAVDPQEYLDRFPNHAEELRRLFGVMAPEQATSVRRVQGKRQVQAIDAGQRLDEFDLLVCLGQGAFARVFLARQRSMQRLVALKISADSGTEPQTLAQFDHDFIVRVYDQRVLPERQMRLLYMQYVPGGSLQDVLRLRRERDPAGLSGRLVLESAERALEARGESRPVGASVAERLAAMTWPEAVCWLGACLAEGLEHAHRCGVLHRDVKPANVLLTAEGIPKLADFNVSCCSKLDGVSPATYFGGSLAYMSPEQLEAFHPAHPRQPESLDGRSDLYSLGIVLWELLTGARPFDSSPQPGGLPATLTAMIEDRRRGLDEQAAHQLPADCPPSLFRVLRRCLAADPDQRWSSGTELAAQLELCRNRPVQEILHPPPDHWTHRLRPWAVPLVVLAAAVPNMLTGAFNFFYNWAWIRESLAEPGERAFWEVQFWINLAAYPLGLGAIGALAWTVARATAGPPSHRAGDAEAHSRLRGRCLDLGHLSAMIGLALWTLAGIAYPAGMHLLLGPMPASVYLHFFGSLLLCGLVITAYPFFGISCLSLRLLYPQRLRDQVGAAAVDDTPQLERLRRRAVRYLISAVSVPFAAVLTLTAFHVNSRFALIALSLASLIGFALIFRCFQRLNADTAVLSEIFHPAAANR